MIQILYGTGSLYLEDKEHGVHQGSADHETRAKALSAVTPGSNCGPVTMTAIQKPDLDTLTYWGHGDAMKFCGFAANDFVANVSMWKKLNPGLKTVEIITCNARHSTTDLTFTSQAKPLLRKKSSDIVLKGMPMGMGSISSHNWSILKAHAPTRTWFYVTAGGTTDQDEMWPAVHLVEAEALNCGSNLATAGAAVERANPSRKFGLRYGTFDRLRATLTAIS